MNSSNIPNLRCRAWWPALPSRIMSALLLTAAMALAGSAQAQTATLTDIGSTPPTPGADDVSQLLVPSAPDKPDGLNYYVNNNPPPGQIFTTGSNPAGYTLTSLALATAGDSGGGIPGSPQAYILRLYSVSGATATLMATYTSQSTFTFSDLDWLQWTGISLGLQPNTQYAYSFAETSFGWENLANVSGNPYPGGEVALIPTGGGAMSLGSSHSYDASFDVGLSPVTTIAVNPPVIAPQAAVTPGTAVTISTAPAVGAPPLYYQWQTDGGSGGALTNIPSATTTSLSVSTTGMKPGSYQYAVVVTNSTSSFTSTVVVLAVYQLSGAALTDVGTTIAPAQYDISQLNESASYGGSLDGLNYYDNNNPPPGQTFTTGSNPQGYYLNSVTLGTGGGTSGHTAELRPYNLYVYSVNGSIATLMASFTNASFLFTYGDWLEWSGFAPLWLKPNTTYAYAFYMPGDGWAAMGASPGTSDLYSGGQIGLIPTGGGPITFGASGTCDAAFDLGLTPVGIAPTTPSVSPITISPSLIVYAGTQVTVSEAATGATPLHYQWQTDGASGGSLTNIPVSNVANLVLDTTGWAAGIYRFDVTVTNSYGSAVSSVVSLTIPYTNGTAVLADIGATISTPAPDDVSQTIPTGGPNAPDGLNYYFNNDDPPGQTFTTGSNPAGYTLSSLAIDFAGNSGGFPAAGQSYVLHVYSVSSGDASLYATFTSQSNFVIAADTDWLRFSGLALPLAANTVYAYTFYGAGGWDNLANVSGSPYASGEVCLIPPTGGLISFGSSHDYDGVFVVGLARAGYPVVAPPAFSPASTVYAGSPVIVSASVTGTGPSTYQWQTDGGNTGTFTNIPGAIALNFLADTTGQDGLTVAYRLVASNSSGSTTGEAALLTVNPASAPIVASPYSLPENNMALIGSTITLRVNEAGTLPITNQWTFNGVNLTDSGRLSGSTSGTLTISNVQSSDAGYYQLNLTNSDGSYAVYPGGGADQNLAVAAAATFFTNGVGWGANGSATIANNVLTLTAGTSEASSFFFNSPIYIGAFLASFVYQDVGGAGADGFTFCLQNLGLSALGAAGGSLGVSGISPSAELTFNIYANNTPGISFGTNGANGSPYNSTAPVNIAGGDPIGVNLVYMNGVLHVTLTDTNAGTTFTTNIPVGSLPAVVGGETAYVGLTGGSGSVGSTQTITDFTYVPLTGLAVQVSGRNLLLSWPAMPGGYTLQSTASLTSPNWQPVGAAVSQVAGQNRVSIPIGAGSLFYRLAIQVPPQ